MYSLIFFIAKTRLNNNYIPLPKNIKKQRTTPSGNFLIKIHRECGVCCLEYRES